MPINNNICSECDKSHVCKWECKVNAFSEEKKKPIGVTIKIEECEEFKKVN